MTINQLKNRELSESSFVLQPYLLRFVGVVAVLLIIIPLLPGLMSNLTYSFSGESPKIYWYLSRSAGFVAIMILWIAMALGLSITNKMARLWPGAPTVFAIHEYVSLLGLIFVTYHGLTLMGDHFVDFSLPRLLLPFSIKYKPLWVGLGQVGFYVWVIAALSFYVRRWIGQKTWRLIHYANFATFIMGWLHGIFSGTDSNLAWARWYYWILGGSLFLLLAYRVHTSVWKKVSLVPQFIRQYVQILTKISRKSKPIPFVPTEKRIPEALFREQAVSLLSSPDKTIMPAITFLKPSQTMSENPEQGLLDEKSHPRTSKTQAIDDKSQLIADASRVASPLPVSEARPVSAALVKKYEIGTGKNKINVRIFKEPPIQSIPVESQEDAQVKRVEISALMLRLKKDFTTTPIQPSATRHTLE